MSVSQRNRAVGLVAGLALASLVLGFSGCGNARRDFRVEKLNPMIKRLDEQRAALASVLRTSRPGRSRDAQALRAELGKVKATVGGIAALDPPEGTRAQFARYIRANRRLSSSLTQFVDAFASGDASAQRKTGPQVAAAAASADTARTQLQHALR